MAFQAVVHVVYESGDAIDIQGQGVSEKNDHQHRKRQCHDQASRISHNVQKFLAGYGPCPPKIHILFSLALQ